MLSLVASCDMLWWCGSPPHWRVLLAAEPLRRRGPRMARPNVLVILADDLGIGDISAYSAGAAVATPFISELAASGVRFTDAHAHTLCSPSRYSLLSGNYVFRGRYTSSAWNVFNGHSQFLPRQQSLAAAFRAAGYETCLVGKWGIGDGIAGLPDHLAPFASRPAAVDWLLRSGRRLTDGPSRWGFNHSLAVPQGIQAPPFAWFRNGELQAAPGDLGRCWGTATHNTPTGVSVTGQFGGHVVSRGLQYSPCEAAAGGEPLHDGADDWQSHMHDALLTQAVLSFWRHRRRAAAAGPFFVLAATAAVHAPHTPRSVLGQTRLRPHEAMVAELDTTVGALLAGLREDGALDNTIVVFVSDNGGLDCAAKQLGAWRPQATSPTPNFDHPSSHCGSDSSGGLRGYKGELYEGGHRVPLLIRWTAGGVPRGVDCADLVGLTDLYATLLDLVGAPPPVAGHAADSVSFKRRLLAPSVGHPARTELLVPNNLAWAFRHLHWKLVGRATAGRHQAEQLFDLAVDPSEAHDLLNASRPVLSANRILSARLLARVRSIGAPVAPRRPPLRSTGGRAVS